MRHAIAHSPAGHWPETEAQTQVTLAFEDRHRRRIRLTDDHGDPFLLDLPHAVLLAEGDGLILEEGGYIRVCAAAQRVLDVKGQDACHLARLAWHIGNRHTPVQVLEQGLLRLAYDHVLAEMLTGLGATVEEKEAPFSPEPGAYHTGSSHGEGHAHG